MEKEQKHHQGQELRHEEHGHEEGRSNEIASPLAEPLVPRWKKPLQWAMGVFMILLMISFVFVAYPVGPIIEGKIESNLLKNNHIDTGEFVIYFEGSTFGKLSTMYSSNQKTEFSACLVGEKKGDDYVITSLYQPKMYEQTYNHVSFEPCRDETVVMLHSHPFKRCLASDTDINTLKRIQKRNKDTVMVVMCEPDRFSVYS